MSASNAGTAEQWKNGQNSTSSMGEEIENGIALAPPAAFIGCAGWAIPGTQAEEFSGIGSHLERYATRFTAVEINSSFYRPHKPETYARWAAAVPEQFRFAVKVPKSITHGQRLRDAADGIDSFLGQVAGLGAKLGPLLVQLPPSLAFDSTVVSAFFQTLRENFSGGVVCEPRHLSWFTPESERLLYEYHVARVAADPSLTPSAARPSGWDGLTYYRLHGSPRTYYSSYPPDFLNGLADSLRASLNRSVLSWCIFDNTAAGAATANALEAINLLQQ